MAKPWYVGDVAKVSVTFTVSGVATDPSTIELSVQSPSGTTTTYSYAATSVTKASTGSYYKNVTLDAEGTWYWRWKGTGNATAADEGEIVVKPSVFV
jgi:hypothetical protein